jgi:hypothetical protein
MERVALIRFFAFLEPHCDKCRRQKTHTCCFRKHVHLRNFNAPQNAVLATISLRRCKCNFNSMCKCIAPYTA